MSSKCAACCPSVCTYFTFLAKCFLKQFRSDILRKLCWDHSLVEFYIRGIELCKVVTMAENWHETSSYMPCLFSTSTHFVTGLDLVQLDVLVVRILFDLAGEPDNIFSKFHFWLFIYTKRNVLYEIHVVRCKITQCTLIGFDH